jgi:hypothetical protein
MNEHRWDDGASERSIARSAGAAVLTLLGTAALALGIWLGFDARTLPDAALISLSLGLGFGLVGAGPRSLRGQPVSVTRGWPGAVVQGLLGVLFAVLVVHRIAWEHRSFFDLPSFARMLPFAGLLALCWLSYTVVVRLRQRRVR